MRNGLIFTVMAMMAFIGFTAVVEAAIQDDIVAYTEVMTCDESIDSDCVPRVVAKVRIETDQKFDFVIVKYDDGDKALKVKPAVSKAFNGFEPANKKRLVEQGFVMPVPGRYAMDLKFHRNGAVIETVGYALYAPQTITSLSGMVPDGDGNVVVTYSVYRLYGYQIQTPVFVSVGSLTKEGFVSGYEISITLTQQEAESICGNHNTILNFPDGYVEEAYLYY